MAVHRMCFSSLAAAVLACLAPSVHASRFDGNWSMVAETTRGHCGIILLGLAVKQGQIRSTGGFFAGHPVRVSGRVSKAGRVHLKAVAGPRLAKGDGRFSQLQGTGTWAGRGPSGLCSGVWSAGRP